MPKQHQAITWTNADLLPIGLSGTKLSEIWISYNKCDHTALPYTFQLMYIYFRYYKYSTDPVVIAEVSSIFMLTCWTVGYLLN